MTTHQIVVMGVSGSGKTTVGTLLAERLGVDFADGDDLHPPASIAKMSAGIALDDADREPWLTAVGSWLAEHTDGGVIACSALKRQYRDALRALAPETTFVELDADPSVIEERVTQRLDHFMPASLVNSQLETLEPLQEDESGFRLHSAVPAEHIVDECIKLL